MQLNPKGFSAFIAILAAGLIATSSGCASSPRRPEALRPEHHSVTHSIKGPNTRVTAHVARACYRNLHKRQLRHPFPSVSRATQFASEHLFPRRQESWQTFQSIGQREGLRFTMRSGRHADVVALRPSEHSWQIAATGHC